MTAFPLLLLRLALTMALVFSAAIPALAASCAPLGEVVAGLASKYGERPMFTGIVPNGQAVTLLAAADGSTWTLLVEAPGGLACMAASGGSWVVPPFGPPLTAPGEDG